MGIWQPWPSRYASKKKVLPIAGLTTSNHQHELHSSPDYSGCNAPGIPRLLPASGEEAAACMTQSLQGVIAMQKQACGQHRATSRDALEEFTKWLSKHCEGVTLLDCTPDHVMA